MGITFPGNDSAQFDLLYETGGYEHPGATSYAGIHAVQIASEDFTILSMGGLVSCCGLFDDLARSWRFGGASFPITPFWHHPEFQTDPNA